jgi:hypothetical protein
METMLGISLDSYLYLKLAKILCLSYYLLYFLFNKIREEGKRGSAWKRGGWGSVREWEAGGEIAQTMYACMNK